VVNCTKHETHNLDVPFGLKTIPTTVVQSIEKTIVEPVVEIIAPPVEQPVVETVVEYLSLSEQINKTIKQLLANGLSIRDIKNQLGCSDAEMLELLDINNTTVFKHVEKLAKWNNTNFVI
jgi:biotin operon repressor